MTKPHRLAVALDQARKTDGLTIYQLAAKAGVSHSTIWQLSSGTHTPRLDTFDLIAAALGYELQLVKRGVGQPIDLDEMTEVYAFDDGPAGLIPISAEDLAGLRSPRNRARIRRAWQTAWQPIEDSP